MLFWLESFEVKLRTIFVRQVCSLAVMAFTVSILSVAVMGFLLPATADTDCIDSAAHVPCFQLAGGSQLPQIALGTWSGSFKDCNSSDFTCVKQHARFAVDNWLHIGGRHIDGANDYRTQTSISEALTSSGLNREKFFLTTKCPGAIGFEATIQCADDNLQMLGQFGSQGAGYIDLLLIHFPFAMKPACRFRRNSEECTVPFHSASKETIQDTWRAMEELKRIGVVKAIGVSDFNTTQLQYILDIAKQPIELNQVEWNPSDHNDEMLAFCKKHNIRLQAWSPLGGKKGSVLGDPMIKSIAASHNVSTAQVVLRWSLQRGVAVVVGSANPDHQLSDIDTFSFQLSEEEVQKISQMQVTSKKILHI